MHLVTPAWASGGFGPGRPDPGFERTSAMTIEILYLTAQIQRWLNERIARHLAAQAAKLDH